MFLQHSNRSYRYIDLITAAFVAILLISNVASSAKIVWLGFSVAGVPFSIDAGTFLFPLTYIFDDVLTEVYGYGRSRRVIWTGFAAMILMTACFAVIQRLPGDAQWQEYAGDGAYSTVLGGVSSGGIIVASLCAFFLGEFSNSFVLAKMKIWTSGKHLWTRTIGSTLIGQFLDSSVFVLIATTFGVFPWSLALALIVGNYVFKVLIEVLFTPATYAIVRTLKKAENEDFYDRATNFNPFHPVL